VCTAGNGPAAYTSLSRRSAMNARPSGAQAAWHALCLIMAMMSAANTFSVTCGHDTTKFAVFMIQLSDDDINTKIVIIKIITIIITSNNSNGSDSRHRRRARIVQSYSPGCADVHSSNAWFLLGPTRPFSRFAGLMVVMSHADYATCDICSYSPHLAVVLAMRSNNE